MFDRLRALFEEGAGRQVAGSHADELEVAVAALLVETASADASLGEDERGLIRQLLERRFGLAPDQAMALEAAAERRAENSAQLFGFARTITERLPRERRLVVIELLWEVAYADGVLDPLEDSLVRRIGGLIDVSDHERGEARLRVLARLGLKEEE
ncbi:MAG TPA: TerB family tellurite resistance protein [Stellaceae bacterium]|nr:TerB family tellurite resistance protein [Stellaceae bacterium]